MARKAKIAPTYVEPEFESQEIEEEAEETETETETEEDETDEDEAPASVSGSVNQVELVRRAIAAGHQKPASGVAYIKDEFGVDVDPRYFSVAKGNLKKRGQGDESEPAKRGRKPKATAPSPAPSSAHAPSPAKVEGYLAPPPKPMSNGSELLDALEAMKPLVASLGKEQAHRLIELLG